MIYFADDIVLLSSTRQQLQNKTARIDREAKRVGLKINVDKTKVMKINAKNQEGIAINGSNIDEAAECILEQKCAKKVEG